MKRNIEEISSSMITYRLCVNATFFYSDNKIMKYKIIIKDFSLAPSAVPLSFYAGVLS